MNFDFSEDQKLLQSEAQKFLQQQCSNDLVRSVMEDGERFYAADLWQKMIELEWPGLAIPEQYGGHGLGYLELCVLAQALGGSLAPVPFSSTVYLLGEALKMAGSKQQQQEHLSDIAAGKLIGCVAVTERLGGSIHNLPDSRVINGKLSGQKAIVTDAMCADLALVSARNANNAYSLYLLPLDQPTVTRTPVNTLDPSRPAARLQFDGAEVEPLGAGGKGQQILEEVYDRAAVLFAFEQVGGCQAALQMGMAYSRERFAFGRPVASFQAIKHKFADMYVAQEIALANAYYAAWALASDAPELPLAAATARVSAIDAYFLCSKENLQAHGGMGYTWEFDCHLHYRRAQHLSVHLGGAPTWKNQVATELLATKTAKEA
ncbi:MAG: acyl-CoA/acyl-ACP dehydrogenase [Gammaproteobacteria bacterium]|nr:acyl-CoA/acyl-ACP dehydrogenase [Gammaproteobacteria bacterium]